MKERLIFLVIIIFLTLFFLVYNFNQEGRVYDCGVAEWHPDIPNAVKEECRRLRYEEWRRQNPPNYSTISI